MSCKPKSTSRCSLPHLCRFSLKSLGRVSNTPPFGCSQLIREKKFLIDVIITHVSGVDRELRDSRYVFCFMSQQSRSFSFQRFSYNQVSLKSSDICCILLAIDRTSTLSATSWRRGDAQILYTQFNQLLCFGNVEKMLLRKIFHIACKCMYFSISKGA